LGSTYKNKVTKEIEGEKVSSVSEENDKKELAEATLGLLRDVATGLHDARKSALT